ncbi:MAG TPA: hypothetical protein VD993_10960 [Chitinophagaceae bacterium]|nr:hypothetical protein [Chitinophagaceae bacterium]
MKPLSALLAFLFVCIAINAQTVSTFVGSRIDKNARYLFYLHGGVVTVLGDNAVNQSVPEWGPYEYSNICDTLRRRGFNVISEIRQEGIEGKVYTNKIVQQVDSLLKGGVSVSNIVLVGASSGWDIVLHVASVLKHPHLQYVIMGGCWPGTYKDYTGIELYGHFLSIIETTDPHGTCIKVFEGRKHLTSYKEVTLNTGLSHGFFYKGRKEWIDPIMQWLQQK